MAPTTSFLEPNFVEGPLFVTINGINISLPTVSEAIYNHGMFDTKVFVRELARCNDRKLQALTSNVFLTAVGEFARQRFAKYPEWFTKTLEASFQYQFSTPDNAHVIPACQLWRDFINRRTPLLDVLDVFLYVTSKETWVPRLNNELIPNEDPILPSATNIVALEPGQLSRLVSEKRSMHVQLPSSFQGKSVAAPISHAHLVRQSSKKPDCYLIQVKPIFQLSIIVTFESPAKRDKIMEETKMRLFKLDEYTHGHVDVVALEDNDKTRPTTKVLDAGANCDLPSTLGTFFTDFGYVPKSLLTTGPIRNGVASHFITVSGNGFDFEHQWLLKVMTPCTSSQTLKVEVQPHEKCQLCNPSLLDPHTDVRGTAPSTTLEISATQNNSTTPESCLGRANDSSKDAQAATLPLTQQSGTLPAESTIISVTEEEKTRRRRAGLCVVCGEGEHVKNGTQVRCDKQWTKPFNTSSPEPPKGSVKRPEPGDRQSPARAKRARTLLDGKPGGFESR